MNTMNDQNKRAVEGLARCGISLEGLYEAFPRFPMDEIKEIYERLHGGDKPDMDMVTMKVNCS